MKSKSRFFFFFLVFLTVLSILIVAPTNVPIKTKFTIPLIQKQISIDTTLHGLSFNFWLGNTHVRRSFSFHKGLDIEGGTSITLKAQMKGVSQDQRDNALESAKTVIEKRVNLFGVSEPVVRTIKGNDEYRIVAELPGITAEQATSLIGSTAQLTFWEATSSATDKSTYPQGITSVISPYAHKTDLTGKDLENAVVSFDNNTGKPQVQLTFTPSGTEKFASITKRNLNKPLVMALDDQVIEAPIVNTPIVTGDAVITGAFTLEQANAVVVQLRAGALPVPLSVLSVQSIGATLGTMSLEKSLFAGVLGFAIIIIFMVVLYGRLGMVASFALCLYGLFVLALFKLIPVTITLAGIAGFILSIGMAVDANILIFERMKEEMRKGKTMHVAVELGFLRAWTSIRDSNVSTLITSFILYQFGTGIVRGFAVTLAMGVLVSMFSAIVITRTFLRIVYK